MQRGESIVYLEPFIIMNHLSVVRRFGVEEYQIEVLILATPDARITRNATGS